MLVIYRYNEGVIISKTEKLAYKYLPNGLLRL